MSRLISNFLSQPFFYEQVQILLGARNVRRKIVQEYIKPFPGARILDVGCGIGTILDYLPESVEYIGIDHNSKYITEARNKFTKRGRFICGDINELPDLVRESSRFDRILAIGLLHHLNDREALQLFDTIDSLLQENGIIITLDCTILQNQSWIARYIMSKDRGQFVRDPDGYRKLAQTRFSSIEVIVPKNLIRIPYNHCFMKISKV